jgi:biotin carboxyl carrier protein
MKLEIEQNGTRKPLVVENDGSGYTFLYGSSMGEADVLEVERGVYSVLLGGRSFEARVTSEGNEYDVQIGEHRFILRLHDPREARDGTRLGAGPGPKDVCAPMPGKVIKLLVCQGDQVDLEQGLVVVEAMKMENEMKAPKSGRVVNLAVKEGDTVAAGQVLATLE